MYGTTPEGGTSGSSCNGYGCGVAFKLTRCRNGKRTEDVLHDFYENDPLGYFPRAGLVIDAAGNLYGTTDQGGTYGSGAVYELMPGKNGKWSAKVLHYFGGGIDGIGPQAPLTFDGAGTLYGTTSEGGDYYQGTVFRLTRSRSGAWSEEVLHSFTGSDGSGPHSRLVFDAAGNLYGTTSWGGAYGGCGFLGCGTAFELAHGKNGTWTAKVLHSFGNGADGAVPWGDLVLDKNGNLYGITIYGGTQEPLCIKYGYGCGTVFELNPRRNGEWTERTLHRFNSQGGYFPGGGLIADAAGHIYGITLSGGRYAQGTAYRLTRGIHDKWKKQVLHSFGNGKDGAVPYSGLIFDAAGNLYGTTASGGNGGSGCVSAGCGVVFEIAP